MDVSVLAIITEKRTVKNCDFNFVNLQNDRKHDKKEFHPTTLQQLLDHVKTQLHINVTTAFCITDYQINLYDKRYSVTAAYNMAA